MFSHEGPSRDPTRNAVLAGVLALIAGFCNSGGFILIGSFTSHVTGNVGRISTDVARGEPAAAFFAVLLVVMFFGGAFLATLIIESHTRERMRRGYGMALLLEAVLLLLFVFVAGLSDATHPRVLDAEASILSLAMGLQNSLVTKLSGSVVRTTHLTGVLTDLAIEVARWYRWHRAKLKQAVPMLVGAAAPAERPVQTRSILLGVIVFAFVVGAVLGASVTVWWSRWAMVLPALAVAVLAAIAYLQAWRLERAPSS
ncbi:MAG: DUF1275 domain-containing protein [Archangiaceae bacterium]|nr:DUF1275 domain-containing protein [Archangiaceae bacterium]